MLTKGFQLLLIQRAADTRTGIIKAILSLTFIRVSSDQLKWMSERSGLSLAVPDSQAAMSVRFTVSWIHSEQAFFLWDKMSCYRVQ